MAGASQHGRLGLGAWDEICAGSRSWHAPDNLEELRRCWHLRIRHINLYAELHGTRPLGGPDARLDQAANALELPHVGALAFIAGGSAFHAGPVPACCSVGRDLAIGFTARTLGLPDRTLVPKPEAGSTLEVNRPSHSTRRPFGSRPGRRQRLRRTAVAPSPVKKTSSGVRACPFAPR